MSFLPFSNFVKQLNIKVKKIPPNYLLIYSIRIRGELSIAYILVFYTLTFTRLNGGMVNLL
jgi:hypothetical protein